MIGLAVAGGSVYAGLQYNKRDIVTVQTGRASRQDLVSLVTASGEIKPRNYINIGSNAVAPSRITEILVAEGQQVRRGQLLAKLEAIQPEAEVAAQRASVTTAEAEAAASEASLVSADDNIRTLEASLARTQADLEKVKLAGERVSKLYEQKLVARQEYDQRVLDVKAAEATVSEAGARLQQARRQKNQLRASLDASQQRVRVNQANLTRAQDVLRRTQAISPIDGMVTNLPVRVGETVVPGLQNSPASLIMTIADMSLITAEVKVDETDVVRLKLGQSATVTVDAIPGRSFTGRVIEIGNTAILRSTGLAASQSAVSSQDAKDFKVVVALTDPPEEARPGLSCTAKVVTATRPQALSIPIQALTVRSKSSLEPVAADPKVQAATAPPVSATRKSEDVQGLFVVREGRVVFSKVETGISGATEAEVLSGVGEGEEIVTGSYKVIRTIRNQTRVKVDNGPPGRPES